MKRFVLLIVILLLFPASLALAHSGDTDFKGGHHVGGTSEYHYHHGYPAHDHVNGECPYDFKNRVVPSSSNVSVSTPAPSAVPTQMQKPKSLWLSVLSGIAFLVNGVLVYVFLNIRFATKYAKETAAKSQHLQSSLPPAPKKVRNLDEESFEALANMSDDELKRYFYSSRSNVSKHNETKK